MRKKICFLEGCFIHCDDKYIENEDMILKFCIQEHVFLIIIKTVAAILCAIVILSIFIIPYNYTGVHIANETGETDYKREPNQLMTEMGKGYTWLFADGNGFNNAYAEEDGIPNVLLMGSSHTEALQVAGNENFGYILN